LAEAVPYLILDARDERVREAGVIVGQAMLIAIGINWDGRCRVLAVELANREGPVEFPAGAQSARSARRRVWSGPTITPVSERRFARFRRKRPIGAAMCISCATRSTTCRAESTTTACKSCAGWEPVLGPAKPGLGGPA
jgi:hypothetical protein